MKIVQPSFEIMSYTPDITKLMEVAGRTCYRSEDKICEGSDVQIIEKLKSFKHMSVLEHGSITVRFICDRGVTHELVRHRLASYSQESTRYCAYDKTKFGGEITVIEPFFYLGRDIEYATWKYSCEQAEYSYLTMLTSGSSAQEARSVLPNSLKTVIVMTTNVREWRTVMEQRTHRDAHPQMRQIMCPTLVNFRQRWPVLFDDVGDPEHPYPADETLCAD